MTTKLLKKKGAIVAFVFAVSAIVFTYYVWKQNTWYTFENGIFSFQYLERMGEVSVDEISLKGLGRGAQDGIFRKDETVFYLFDGVDNLFSEAGHITFEDAHHDGWSIYVEAISFPDDLELVLSTFELK